MNQLPPVISTKLEGDPLTLIAALIVISKLNNYVNSIWLMGDEISPMRVGDYVCRSTFKIFLLIRMF